jgi:DNA-binding protein H-NS
MRKPRDFDAELKALTDKTKQLREQKLRQLGELATSTGADTLPIEQLAGALLQAAETKDAATKEGWRKRGATFFQHLPKPRGGTGNDTHRKQAGDGGAAPFASQDRA